MGLTEEEKQALYLNPQFSEEEQIKNEISGYERLISEAQDFIKDIQETNQIKFLAESYITFHDKRITNKEIIFKFYTILISDWHYKIDAAKKELSILKGEPIVEATTNPTKEKLIHAELVDPNPDDINAEFPPRKKSKFGAFLEKFFSYADKTVTILKETNVIKDKK